MNLPRKQSVMVRGNMAIVNDMDLTVESNCLTFSANFHVLHIFQAKYFTINTAFLSQFDQIVWPLGMFEGSLAVAQ